MKVSNNPYKSELASLNSCMIIYSLKKQMWQKFEKLQICGSLAFFSKS